MDFIEYAKWGIRVKEEPGILGPFHVGKPSENNFELQRTWMCKFPCDAEGVLDATAPTDNLPYEFLDQFEPSAVNYLEDGHDNLNLQSSDKFTGSTSAEGNNAAIPHCQLARIIQQDKSSNNCALSPSTSEVNNIVNGSTNSKRTLKDDERQMFDARLNEQCDISEDVAPSTGDIKQGEYTQFLHKNASLKRPYEEAFMIENQNEIRHSKDVEKVFEAPENAVAELVNNSGAMDISFNVKNNLSTENEAIIGETVVTPSLQNCQKENNNDFRISEISSFECPDCGEFLNSFNSFITHMNLHIIQQNGDDNTILCESCEGKFDDDESLSLHKKECSGTIESNLVPSQNKHNNNNNNNNDNIKRNNAVHPTVNCSEKNSVSYEKSVEENSELDLSSHCQEESLKNFPEQQTTQRRDLSLFTSKQRQQSYVEDYSSSEMLDSRNSWTVQNLGAADDAFDVSWSSEIKCREEREEQSLGSVRTLSLRLFRFRRPRVVVQRAQVPARSESVIKALNSSLGNSFSNNIINQKSVCQKENVDNLKQLTKESISKGVNKIPKSNSKVMSCSNIVEPHRKPKHAHNSEKGWHFARQYESTEADRCHLQENLAVYSEPQNVDSLVSDLPYSFSAKISEKDKNSIEPIIQFPIEDSKIRSKLKLKIKPVVVLDRLGSCNINHETNKSSNDNTSKYVGDVSSQKNLSRGMIMSIDSSSSEKCEISDVETNSKMMAKASVDQSAAHLEPYHNEFRQSENGISLADLVKKYCPKKCYVKLKRISEESYPSRKYVKYCNKEDTEGEIKTFGKLKFRRMSSKLWTVSSCTSTFENMEVAEKSAEDRMKIVKQLCVVKNPAQNPSDEVVHNEIYDQRLKKCFELNDPSVTSNESSEEAFNKYMLRGKQVKHFRSECTSCQRTFFDEQDLAQHLETCLSGYKCPNCSARFHFVMELHAHVAGCSLASLLDCRKTQSLIKPCQVVL